MHHVTNFEIVKEVAANPIDVRTRHHLRFGVGRRNAFDPDAQLLVLNAQNDCGVPMAHQFDITRDGDIGQCSTPTVFAPQCIGGHSFPCAIPDT